MMDAGLKAMRCTPVSVLISENAMYAMPGLKTLSERSILHSRVKDLTFVDCHGIGKDEWKLLSVHKEILHHNESALEFLQFDRIKLH